MYRNNQFSSKLIEIDNSTEVSKLIVKKAYTERGIDVLNDSLFVGLAFIIDSDKNKIQVKDDAIWHPEGSIYIPRISDIDSPFELYKNKNNDTLIVNKNKQKLVFILTD